MTQQSGVQGWSSAEAGQSYAILAVDNVPKFIPWYAATFDAPPKIVRRRYKGADEIAFIIPLDHLFRVRVGEFVLCQESVLILGPMVSYPTELRDRAGRPACLHFLNDREALPTPLGHFQATPADEATASDAYTYDPATGTYYTCG